MKIAVISGASSGMGREFAKQIDHKGLDEIWVIARREDRLRELESELLTPVKVLAFDLLNPTSFDIFKHILSSEQPNIKYLINCAGFGNFGNYELELEKVNRMIDLNIKALVNMTYLCISYMEKGSHIIELGSASAFTPLVNFNIYASTKAFVLHFSYALNEELKGKGIHVSCICPGWVKTEFFKEADPKKTEHAPRIIRPLYKTKYIVNYAITQSDKNKMLVVPGKIMKLQHLACKIFPKKWSTKVWKLNNK